MGYFEEFLRGKSNRENGLQIISRCNIYSIVSGNYKNSKSMAALGHTVRLSIGIASVRKSRLTLVLRPRQVSHARDARGGRRREARSLAVIDCGSPGMFVMS